MWRQSSGNTRGNSLAFANERPPNERSPDRVTDPGHLTTSAAERLGLQPFTDDAGTLAHQITRGRCRKGTRQVNDSGYFV